MLHLALLLGARDAWAAASCAVDDAKSSPACCQYNCAYYKVRTQKYGVNINIRESGYYYCIHRESIIQSIYP